MTTENNKIIAEFMRLSKNLHLYESPITGKYIEVLKYDTSWSWLMRVVEKIESLGYGVDIQSLGVHLNTFEGTKHKYNRFFLCGKTKIEAVYNACVEFIKWYNEQNK